MCVETGVEYPSAVEAATQTGISKHHIWANARGARQDAGGYQWRYLEPSKRSKSSMPDTYSEHKSGIRNGRARPICCVETGEIFQTGIDLAKSLGVGKPYVSSMMSKSKTCRGLHYEFIDKGDYLNGLNFSES